MYKNITIVILSLLFLQTAKAQEFNSGLYGGLVASQLDGDRYAGYNKAGLVAGGFVNRLITKKMAYQFGLRYIEKGSKKADSESSVYYKSQFHYIEMPLTVKYYHYKKINFEFGLALGYLIKASEDRGGYGLKETTDSFNKFEISGLAGLNYEFTDKITFSGMFQYSVTQIGRSTETNTEFFKKGGLFNNSIYFSLAYKFSRR